MAITSNSGTAPQYCAYCGCFLKKPGPNELSVCEVCNRVAYNGPRVLVISLIFAEDRMLLLKRGSPPYVGTWAPPGGFVEANESVELAAVREIAEEVGIWIDPAQLMPRAIASIPAINQVYFGFLVVLERMQAPKASRPEALDARWFTLEDFPNVEMWPPSAAFDVTQLFEQVRSGHFYFNQSTGESVRLHGPYIKLRDSGK